MIRPLAWFCCNRKPDLRQTLLPALLLLALLVHPAVLAADTLTDIVNRGNIAAEKEDYPTAIKLYEQAVQKAPNEAVLKKNLAVLYANYGVRLHDQKQDTAALQYLDKGMALAAPGSKEAKNIQEARAGIYFSQAMDLRDSTENGTPEDYARMRALLEKAMALNPSELAFKKGMAGIYLDEAYQLAIQERFAEAQPLLEKALTYDSQNKAVRQSLANVYLGLAKNDAVQRQALVDKALAMDNSPRIQHVAEQILGKVGSMPTSEGFADTPGEARAVAPREISKLSVADMLKDMEAQLQMTPAKDATLEDRLEAVEKQVLGKSQDGALAVRSKAVYTALMGSYDGTLSQSNPKLMQAPAGSSDRSYLDEIFKVTDGKVIRWGKFPLRVYFETPKDNDLFKPEYKEAALQGFNIWKERTNGFVNFVEIQDPNTADIQVVWTEQYQDRFADPDNVPTIYKNYSPPKRSPLMTAVQVASMLTPGYFSLAPQAAAAALQYQQQKKVEGIREESKIKLGLGPVRELSRVEAMVLMQNMAAKEFGHVLGLKGTSPQEGDLLYPELRSDVAKMPSQRDLETLRELYNRPPNIILNVR